MSGGSYNYLFCKDADDIPPWAETLRHMADRLTGLGYAEDAAGETEDLIAIIAQYQRRAQTRIDRLRDVWQAVEWWDSQDGGEDGLVAALAKYREGPS